jgi:hypothetical protein
MKKLKINFAFYCLGIFFSLLISCSTNEKKKEDNSMQGMDMSKIKDTNTNTMEGMDMTETRDTSSNKMEGMNMADSKNVTDITMNGMNMNHAVDTTLVRFANETYH